MPTYQYACTHCDERLEVVQRFSDATLTECTSCQGRLRKVFSPVGVVFKGPGFYRTDSRAKATENDAGKADGGSKADKGGKDSSKGDKGSAKDSKGNKGDNGSGSQERGKTESGRRDDAGRDKGKGGEGSTTTAGSSSSSSSGSGAAAPAAKSA